MQHRLLAAATAVILPLAPGAAQTASPATPKANNFYPSNKAPLGQSAYSILPLGAVMPQGWLQQQLNIQATSLTGNLPKFWPDLGPDNGWLGGKGESWERGPYYTDGMVPLAFLTQHPELLDMAGKWAGWTLDNQRPDGGIGPESCKDWWPLGLMCKTLTQYYDATGDPRVIPVLTRFFAYMKVELPKRQLFEWAKMRWADTVLSTIWLYNRTGNPELLEVSKLLMAQGHDYARQFSNFEPYSKASPNWNLENHGVNAGMAYKTPGVMFQLTGNAQHRQAVYDGITNLDQFHGQAGGTFAADECFAGPSPTQGTELCSVGESMFSFENLMAMFGDPMFGDKLERMSYNAWPGTFSPDMWAHQYDQQANQPMCRNGAEKWFITNGGGANLFGVEPQYGCCTANMHQGWPKFVRHLWMATPDDGLAAVAYGPCVVTAKVKGGHTVSIGVVTDYPFSDTIRMTIQTAKPVEFPLQLRIPAWALGATIQTDTTLSPQPGTFATITRTWNNGDTVNLKLPMKIRIERRFNNSATVLRGPLVFALRIGESWQKFRGDDAHPEYEVLPTTPWNYGLIFDEKDPEQSFKIVTKPLTDPVYSSKHAPIELHAKGRILPQWKEARHSADLLPVSPVQSAEPVQDIVLIPYGCAKLRITEFPVLAQSGVPTAKQPLLPEWDSLKNHPTPEWYQDANFGIYAHWGGYCVPAYINEWDPRGIYLKNSAEYQHHLSTYGDPSQFGYKDFIPMFKADKRYL
ncbi:MAG: glycoside hydrolase family 127 protein [Verrucomicrobia bacterium]|nr:glycoside hydrolase family 127 protein [Verrucomicrobiota bacterium]